MSKLMAHSADGRKVTLDDLRAIPTPEETATWTPVGHAQFAMHMKRWCSDSIANNYSLESEQYAVARKGQQMFGLLTFKNGNEEMGLSIGFRNSIDKSLAGAFASGGQVFVCDNLALNGDIVVMRKHTMFILHDLQDLVLDSMARASNVFGEMVFHAEQLKQIPYTTDEGYERIGLLYGNGVLTPRQLPVILKEWVEPQHKCFEPRNAWSLYNAATEALKSCPPQTVLEKHRLLTDVFRND